MDDEKASQHPENPITHQFQLDRNFDHGCDRFMQVFTTPGKAFGAILDLDSGKLNFWRQSNKTEDKGSLQQCSVKLEYNYSYPFVVTNSFMPQQSRSILHNMLTSESQTISLGGQ